MVDNYISKWHEDYQPDPHPQVGDIYSGLRAPIGKRSKDVTSPCQYWIKGMPGICIQFSSTEDRCIAESDDNGKYPTGYNNGKCDYLGRRNWCSHYDNGGKEDLEEYICIAPDTFRTGLGKRDETVTTYLKLIPYSKSEILGYNPDEETGAGKCDGLGMGRGKDGEEITDPEKMYKLPVVCRHYKPWMMGFGAIKPRPMGEAVLTGKNIYDGSASDPLTDMSRYLPFIFRMLNLRAHYQKCAYWGQDYGTFFEMDYSGGYATIELPEDPLTECTCTDSACTPYKTIISTWPENSSDTLVDVLTEEGSFICNGAHSECPCYTGKWYFCVADNMRDGMRITAEQILEIRFWTAVWQTKEIYDAIFAEKSGPLDVTTSDIFTFDRWEKLGTDVNDSVMKGKRIYQCFPIPYNQRVFDPEVYITKEAITYPKATTKTGTSDSKKSSFPTLIRKVDDVELVPPLDVIYPYPCKDPWDVKPCDEGASKELMEIASCKMESPATAVFGYTVRNKDVYVLNISKIASLILGGQKLLKFFLSFKNTMVALFPEDERQKINNTIDEYIKYIDGDVILSKYIMSGVSNEYGYFGVGPLLLDYNTTTIIAIVCRVKPQNEYEIVLREVESKFYGGTITQNNFEFKYEKKGHFVTLPANFSPPAKLKGNVVGFEGTVGSIFPVYNNYKYGITNDTAYYSYCVNEYTVDGSEAITTQWVRVGPTGYIFAEIDNIEISYLFDFEVTSAYIRRVGEVGHICGESSDGKIELEVVYPKVEDPNTGDSNTIKRKHLLPSGVLLKSSEPQGFFNEDCTLYIEYKYKKLEPSKPSAADSKVETVWPIDLDGEESMNKFVDPPFTLKQESRNEGEFEIENIRTGTIELMAYIEDGDGRIQSAVATKMLLDVVTTRCRPVEIFYAYMADAVKYDLIPNSGFFTWVGGDKVIGAGKHYNRPKCGDHDCNSDNCIGPMWFPFNNCTTKDFYSWYSGAAVCTNPIEGQGGPLAPTPRHDWRYCMAHDYKAWVRTGGNWAASCGNGWYYSYSKAGESVFSGYAKIRTSVNLNEYSSKWWTPPPFGNDGREITERWLSQEFYGFWDLSGIRPVPRNEYMPLVFDDEMLFTSFDAFEEKGRIGSIDNYFHATCMLNCMLSNGINEELTEDRYRFEDLFKVITQAWCMYPPPVGKGPGDTATSIRYSFKIENIAWAWREYWKDIERGMPTEIQYQLGSDGNKAFDFVYFNKPPYYFDFIKTEHRLITDEGRVTIIFKAPIGSINEEGEEEFKHPEISIDNGFPRKFEVIYDDYNSEQVVWLDEGGDGSRDSSGGEEEKSIYEEAMGDDWVHGVNTIFDANASTEKTDDRKLVMNIDSLTGDEEYKWYNRGLIANILKNRLAYLPYKVIGPAEFIVNNKPDNEEGDCRVWYNDSVNATKDVIFTYVGGLCIMSVKMFGHIGVKENSDYSSDAGTYCRPKIIISYCSIDDVDKNVASTILYEKEGKSGKGISEKGGYTKYLENYDFDIELSRLPKRVLYRSPLFQVKCTLFPGQHLMLCGEDYLVLMWGKYVDAEETLKVWEQKYITSTGKFGDKNPDGPESFKLRSYERNLKNAGQYFPTGINSPNQDNIKMLDKMTMVGAGKQYQENEDLSISKSNLKTIESEKQRKLYNDAYNKDDYDIMSYSITLPPNIQQFFNENNIHDRLSGVCEFISGKLPWDNHVDTVAFNQDFDFWSPGGHYFVWDDKYRKTKCWIIGPVETIYSPKVVHYKHAGADMIWTPYQAYVGWAKWEYYMGKLTQAVLLEKGIDTGYDWTGPAGGFVIETFQ